MDTDPYSLSLRIDANYQDVLDMWHASAQQLGAVDRTEVFMALAVYLDEHIAQMLSARQLLQMKLGRDLKARDKLRQRILNR